MCVCFGSRLDMKTYSKPNACPLKQLTINKLQAGNAFHYSVDSGIFQEARLKVCLLSSETITELCVNVNKVWSSHCDKG